MGLNRMPCCISMALHDTFEDFMDIIDRDCSAIAPGLRRESRDEQHDTSDRSGQPMTKTAGNALQLQESTPTTEAQPSPKRVSVIVPGSVPAGQTIYVQFLDECNKPKTVAAIIPPNSYPGMQFYVEVPQVPESEPKKGVFEKEDVVPLV